MTIRELSQMLAGSEHWAGPLMEFVDDFRRDPQAESVAEPVRSGTQRLDALVAATIEQLCSEANMPSPEWTVQVKSVDKPWLVSGIESLRGLAFAESPAPFRSRRIFVLGNFLNRA